MAYFLKQMTWVLFLSFSLFFLSVILVYTCTQWQHNQQLWRTLGSPWMFVLLGLIWVVKQHISILLLKLAEACTGCGMQLFRQMFYCDYHACCKLVWVYHTPESQSFLSIGDPSLGRKFSSGLEVGPWESMAFRPLGPERWTMSRIQSTAPHMAPYPPTRSAPCTLLSVTPSRNIPNKNLNKDPFATCGVALVLTSALGVVQTLEPAGRPGIRECLICRLLLTWFSWRRNQQRYLRFIDLPIVIPSVTWQGVRNQTNFLAPFSTLITPYLAVPGLEIRQQPSLRIWSENLWWVVLKPQKHWESHSDV